MTSIPAALAGDLAENGLSVSNTINTGFALPALSWLRYASKFKRDVAEY